jgi:hypothetical protein
LTFAGCLRGLQPICRQPALRPGGAFSIPSGDGAEVTPRLSAPFAHQPSFRGRGLGRRWRRYRGAGRDARHSPRQDYSSYQPLSYCRWCVARHATPSRRLSRRRAGGRLAITPNEALVDDRLRPPSTSRPSARPRPSFWKQNLGAVFRHWDGSSMGSVGSILMTSNGRWIGFVCECWATSQR